MSNATFLGWMLGLGTVIVACAAMLIIRHLDDRNAERKEARRRHPASRDRRLNAMVAEFRKLPDAIYPSQTVAMESFERRFEAHEQQMADILTRLVVDTAVEK